MALSFEKKIDLTRDEKNPDPKIVRQLSIIHEAKDGELVQYYISPNSTQGDKATRAIGVYDKKKGVWTYQDYGNLIWGSQKQRIAGNRIEKLGVKAFPNVGAIAFYKLAHRDISRIVAPVNREGDKLSAPALSGVQTETGVDFTITPPEKSPYKAYRLLFLSGDFNWDFITYDLTCSVPAPKVAGTYDCFCIGYVDEGQICSKDSNVLQFTFTGEETVFTQPFYTKEDLKEAIDKVSQVYTRDEMDQMIQDIVSRIQDGDEVEY